ncbi:hypothetical protein AAG570_011712 [Ranatra chinensis]|uniref:Secreted protein n=1 Tax=Ranatra chinensis TaxID=642074 RepID=A0ABD0YH46_9HEMI
MNAFLLSLGVVVASVSGGPVGPKPRVFNKDLDEFLSTANEAVQLMGYNYLDLKTTKVTISDSTFEDMRLGDLSTWKRLENATIIGDSLQNFNVSADVGLGVLHFRVGKFSTGGYNGPLTMMVLDNGVNIQFEVKNRFQSSCNVTVSSLTVKDFADPRYSTDDRQAAGFILEKNYILDFFRETLFSESQMNRLKDMVAQKLNVFFCRKPKVVMAQRAAEMFNVAPAFTPV